MQAVAEPITVPAHFKPRGYQLEFLRAMDNGCKRAILVWPRRQGKDDTCISYMGKRSFTEIGTYFYFFPTYQQGRKALWDAKDQHGVKFIDRIPRQLVARKSDQDMKLVLINPHDPTSEGSIIQVVGTDNIDRVVGTNPLGCVFSEYSLQNPQAWEFMRPILLQNGGWAVFNGTPRGLNHMHEMYQQALNNPEWYVDHRTVETCFDNGGQRVISDEDIERERASGMSENLIRQEYYCDFTASVDEVAIPLDLCLEATKRNFTDEMLVGAERVMGVDLSRWGADSVEIASRCGGDILPVVEVPANERATHLVVGKVAEIARTFEPDAIFIDSAGNPGVIDGLIALGLPVIKIDFGGKPLDPTRYKNLTTEMHFKLRAALENGAKLPYDMKLIADITAPTFHYIGDGTVRVLEQKEHVKKRLGRSPDRGDAVKLTYAMPVYSKQQRENVVRERYAQEARHQQQDSTPLSRWNAQARRGGR